MCIRKERARAELASGFNCAVSVLSAFAEEHGLTLPQARQVAGAFGGGMGRRAHGPCGAASGVLMALGLAYAKLDPGDDAARDRCYAVGRDFLEAFEARCGGLSCLDLLGYDVSDPDQYEAARREGAFGLRCPLLLDAAVELVEARLP